MKKKEFLMYVYIFIGMLIFIKLIDYLTRNSNDKVVIRDIKVQVKGIVVEKIALRKNLYLNVKLKREKKIDTVVDVSSFNDSINIGDSLIKNSNTPYCFIIRNKVKKKYPFTLIPKKMIQNENFPPAWRDSCKTSWKPLLVD